MRVGLTRGPVLAAAAAPAEVTAEQQVLRTAGTEAFRCREFDRWIVKVGRDLKRCFQEANVPGRPPLLVRSHVVTEGRWSQTDGGQ